jgi:hypothetical protein
MLAAAMKAVNNSLLESCKIPPKYIIEINEFPIGIVNNLNRSRFFCEKDCAATEERFTIKPMFRNEFQNPGGKLLLSTVIRERCFHKNPNSCSGFTK